MRLRHRPAVHAPDYGMQVAHARAEEAHQEQVTEDYLALAELAAFYGPAPVPLPVGVAPADDGE